VNLTPLNAHMYSPVPISWNLRAEEVEKVKATGRCRLWG